MLGFRGRGADQQINGLSVRHAPRLAEGNGLQRELLMYQIVMAHVAGSRCTEKKPTGTAVV
jgi:hypothetical protein